MSEAEQLKCEHIYRNTGYVICPMCAQCTHETDWQEQHRLHREWISSGKATAQGWWSI